MPLQITGVNSTMGEYDNPYLAINSLVWIDDYTQNRGITTRDVLFDWINDNGTAYVLDEEGNKAKLLTATTKSGYGMRRGWHPVGHARRRRSIGL